MSRYKWKKNSLIVWLLLLIFLMGAAEPPVVQLELTQEEQAYIAERKVISAVSIDGVAPLHYRDSKGKINGIAISVLNKISDMTGLLFEYDLRETVAEALASDADIIFGITPYYAPAEMTLSKSYMQAETILFINSSVDTNKLDDKIYASIKGGSLPEGIKEENTIYYNSREDVLNAVEKGEADYSYANEYSVAFYTIQNGYQSSITIPKGKEVRAYAIGFLKEDKILLSIINKSIGAISDRQMQTLILGVMSQIERKVAFSVIMDTYGEIILPIVGIVISALVLGIVLNVRARKSLSLQNRKYELLSHISNEYFWEYDIKTSCIKLSEKCKALFGTDENQKKISCILKETISNSDSGESNETISLPFANGEMGVFKAINSVLYDDHGQMYHVIGKLIDVSEEAAEKERLILKTQMDGLTDIYNAITTKELISEIIRNKESHGTDVFIFMDCDKFKEINDTLGHLAGDRGLKNLSKALKAVFRQTDIIGRVGGDEFCVYMKNIPSVDFVQSKCEKLITIVQSMDKDLNLALSIGVAFLEDTDTYESLFKKADDALYEAKGNGGAKVVFSQ